MEYADSGRDDEGHHTQQTRDQAEQTLHNRKHNIDPPKETVTSRLDQRPGSLQEVEHKATKVVEVLQQIGHTTILLVLLVVGC